MEIYGLTDRGVVREANEDSIGISRTKNGITIAVVCDGMGGAAGGRIASEIAEETFMSSMLSCTDEMEQLKFDSIKVKALIGEAASKANAAVLAKARDDLSLFGMGCTLNAIVYIEPQNRLYYVNVGDSRLYMITKKEIKQLTKDHSYVQMLVDNNEITPEEAENHPQKNLITKALGIKDDIEPDVSDKKLAPKSESHFLLCSDGLHGLIKREVLKEVALSDTSIHEKIFSYIRLANEAGGTDNISAILLSIKNEEVSK